MPFDGPLPVTDRPNLATLAYLLRHRERWPARFRWNYERRDTCAIGLAQHFWPAVSQVRTMSRLGKCFGIPTAGAKRIFGQMLPVGRVTPEQVAAEIDLCLATSAPHLGEAAG